MARGYPRVMIRSAVAAALVALVAIAAPSAVALADPAPPPGTGTATSFDGTPTVGALYDNPTTDRHGCTASVVSSPRGDVLLTAAHCMAGTGAGYVFAPGFHGGISPLGRWTVTGAYLDPAWLSGQDPHRDFAFLTVAPQRIDGRLTQIQAVTGANRLGLGAFPGEQVTIPAYPGGTDNDPVTCTTPVYFQDIYPAFNCDPYVGGTSGSPWIAQTPLGPTVAGLIGGLHQGGCFSFTSYSPPLGLHALATYLRAVAGVRPDTAPVAGPDGCS
jgi:V8-like Glu-specific endopeptidase